MDDAGAIFLLLVGLLIGGLLYFVPTIVADKRDKKDFKAIAALNIFLGWTVVGWVVALVWALTEDK